MKILEKGERVAVVAAVNHGFSVEQPEPGGPCGVVSGKTDIAVLRQALTFFQLSVKEKSAGPVVLRLRVQAARILERDQEEQRKDEYEGKVVRRRSALWRFCGWCG
jgi:hypothetical protein